VSDLNRQQRKVSENWLRLLVTFAEREYPSVLLWTAFGAIAAGFVRLLFRDRLFESFLFARYFLSSTHYGGWRLYLPYASVAGLVAILGMVIYGPGAITRGLRSWTEGVTSGLCFLSFASIFGVLIVDKGTLVEKLLIDLGVVVSGFIIGYRFYFKGRIKFERTVTEEELLVPAESKSVIGREICESDDPIRGWEEDALNRAAIVDEITVKVMIAKRPVIALFGKFGSGKTSILNLLREHLAGKAIVVSFSTWLPGSQETLTSYLLGDIAGECRKVYVVPGLSKSARRLASALANSLPFIRGYLEFLPTATQADEIKSMHVALKRLPKRVVVLLDELDRMERDELLTLLKIVRGISTLPNLSFVCAADRRELIKIVKSVQEPQTEDFLYFEKFFPVPVEVPPVDAESLQHAGTERLVATLERRDWFTTESEQEDFRKQIVGVWARHIAPLCHNLRGVGLLANYVGTAASFLRREVHPVDLTLVELLHLFAPPVYEVISRNSLVLTGGDSWFKHGAFYSDQQKDRLKKQFLEDIKQAAGGEEQYERVRGILRELFPQFGKIEAGAWMTRPRTQENENEKGKHIFYPGMFPAYFCYELPQAIYSSVELEQFLLRISATSSAEDLERLFVTELDAMEKGSPKRNDFLRKLSNSVNSMSSEIGHRLVFATMKVADKYIYDKIFVGSGEAGHVLRIVLRVAQATRQDQRLDLLAQCIQLAADDTMALWILLRLTGRQDDTDLGVSQQDLNPAFAARMRSRYGTSVDAEGVDLSTSDPQAFGIWGSLDLEERKIQHNFWLRYIGNSRSRLAQSFGIAFMPFSFHFSEDPTPFIESKIPVADLKRLFEELPDDNSVSEEDRRFLAILKRFLDGEYKNGVSVNAFDSPSSE